MDEILAVVTDLFFQAKINAAARAAGRSVRFAAPNRVPAHVPNTVIVLVDLDAQGDVLHAVREIAATGVNIIAFGPHVDTELRKAAKAAGASRVLAKSKFVTELPRIMNRSENAELPAKP